MHRYILWGLLIFSQNLFGQISDREEELREQSTIDTTGWVPGGAVAVNFSQVSLTNWASGGVSSVSLNALSNLFLDYFNQDSDFFLHNNLQLAYGFLKANGDRPVKTDDQIDLLSKAGKRITEDWYYSALLNFRTQFVEGYNEEREVISDFFAPAYVIGALGVTYNKQWYSVFMAPLTAKFTFVTDPALSEAGAFGVAPGDMMRREFGGYIRGYLKKKIFENVQIQTNLALFSNYLNEPQHIDVNWETFLNLKVNKYISTTLSTRLVYDHDIDIEVDENDDGIVDDVGPRVQFKEVLAVGFNFSF